MSTPLIKDFHYNYPLDKVWQALTDKNKMKEWYFPQIQKFEPIVGFKFEFEDNNDEYQKEWIVTQVEEGKMLAHSWAYKGYPGISEVNFTLFSEENSTRLQVTQTDLETFPDHPHFGRDRFEMGWENLLGQNLKHLLENTSPY